MTDWLKLAADICLSPYTDVASLESLSSSAAGDTGVIGATVAPEFSFDDCVVCDVLTEHCSHGKCLTCEGCGRCKPVSAFAPQGASQGVSTERQRAVKTEKSSGNRIPPSQASPADSQGLTRGVDIQSSAALTEFDDCMYCNQRTVHCQAHARCLSCGEGCRECAVSGLSSHPSHAAQCETSGGCGEALPNRSRIGGTFTEAGANGSGASVNSFTLLRSVNEHYPLERCNECYFLNCPCAGPGVCGCKCHSQSVNDPSAGILTFDEEYGRTYRGRLFTGNTIEELLGAVLRAEQGARR